VVVVIIIIIIIIIILVWVKKISNQFDHWTKPDKNNTYYFMYFLLSAFELFRFCFLQARVYVQATLISIVLMMNPLSFRKNIPSVCHHAVTIVSDVRVLV